MPTKFYLHDATYGGSGGTDPTAGTSITINVSASGATTLRTMNDTIGASQQSAALTTSANTSLQANLFRTFISAALAAQTISAQTVTFRGAASEANAASDMFESGGIAIGVWRPSGGGSLVGWVVGGGSTWLIPTEPGTTQTAVTGSTTSTSVTVQAGDILFVDLVSRQSQSMGTAYTNTVFYDGTTEGSTTSNAAHIEFTNNVSFGSTTHNLAGDITYSPALDGAVARDTFAAGDIAFNPAVDGVLGRETKLSGDVALDITVDGNIAIEAPAHALAGDIAFDPAIDGAVGRETSLTGDIALNPAVDGAVTRTTFVTGDITYAPAVDGVVARTTFVVGDVDLPFAVDGNIAITGGATTHDLAGDIAYNPALDGAFTRTTFAAGDIAFDPALDGVVRVGTSLAGDIAYTITVGGALGRETSLTGDIALVIDVDGNVAFAATVVPATVRAADTHPRAAAAVDTDVSEQAARDLSGVLVAARDLVP